MIQPVIIRPQAAYSVTTGFPLAAAAAGATTTPPARGGPTTMVAPGTLDLELERSNQTLAFEPWASAGMPAYRECPGRFTPPPLAPRHATDLNGIALPSTCFTGKPETVDGLHHVFVIGDWGGIVRSPGAPPVPADHRSPKFHGHRPFVVGADDCAQQRVARQMSARSIVSAPDYVLNVGDNFYWGGINIKCGAPPHRCNDATGQWRYAFEAIYTGPGLDGKQWLGVLGNHDFGGFMFTQGWDQAISYTWASGLATSTGRWVTPALYYSAKVHYAEFSVDYYFVDSNVFDAFNEHADPSHNICSKMHNPGDATCGIQGPVSTEECPKWFKRLWAAQMKWLDRGLSASTADWQIVVTHFPPEHGADDWKRLSRDHGIDLLITGHRHQQEVHYQEEGNFLRPTAYVVSGGGGGITSEALPNANGTDNQYGFMDLALSKKEIMIEMVSHGGQVRSTTCVLPRHRGGAADFPDGGPSLCDGHTLGPIDVPFEAGTDVSVTGIEPQDDTSFSDVVLDDEAYASLLGSPSTPASDAAFSSLLGKSSAANIQYI